MDSNQIRIKAEQERQRLKKKQSSKPKKEFELQPPQVWYRIKNKFKRSSKFESPLITLLLGTGFFLFLYFSYDGILNVYIAAALFVGAIVMFIFLLIDKLRKGNKSKLLIKLEDAIDVVEAATKPIVLPKKVVEKKQYPSNSFYLYQRIAVPTYNWFMWFIFVITPGVTCIYFWMFEDAARWVLWLGMGLVCLFPIRLLVEYLLQKYKYKTYQNFQDNLGFTLTGWDKLGTNSDIFNSVYWVDCKIHIVLKDNTNETEIKLVNDALYLFGVNANKYFYVAMAGLNGRKDWKQQTSLEINGSANRTVFGEIYEFIQIRLKGIQDKYDIIDSVKLDISDACFKVRPKGRRI